MLDKIIAKIKSFLINESSSIFIFLLSIIFFILVFLFTFFILKVGEQQFVYLANSFLHGKTYFLSEPGRWMDTIFFNGQYYWPLGPFPAVFFIPLIPIFNFLNLYLSQSLLSFFLGVSVFYFVYKIARKIKYTKEDSLYWAFAFCFATCFLGVFFVPWSWYFAHTVTVFLLFLIILEYLSQKRYWLIGLLFGLAFLTRVTAVIGVLFFVFEIFFSKIDWQIKRKNISNLIFPICLSVILFFFYNYIRFGNFLDSGYFNQILIDSLVQARSYGLFSIIHIPGNLYYFLLSGPLPVFKDGVSHVLGFPYLRTNMFGMSIFTTSPYFLYLFFISFKKKNVKWLLWTSLFIALAIFSYYGIGYNQFGYRYSLDFLPFLFFALMLGHYEKFTKISLLLKIIIVAGALFNFFLFLTAFRII